MWKLPNINLKLFSFQFFAQTFLLCQWPNSAFGKVPATHKCYFYNWIEEPGQEFALLLCVVYFEQLLAESCLKNTAPLFVKHTQWLLGQLKAYIVGSRGVV